MSINVTVSGNPVNIKRGKMVASSRDDFDKRRLMRLEQVRHQSKNIAENIRNKGKTEKAKQQSELEKAGEAQIKNWQARKLLQLHTQYQDALEDIGLGHKQAIQEELDEETLQDKLKNNADVSKERGQAAADRLQVEKNEESLKKAKPAQRKKLTRDAENSRSEIASKQVKTPSKRKKKQVPISPDSDSENRVPQLPPLEESESSIGEPRDPTKLQRTPIAKICRDQQTSKSLEAPKSDKSAQTQETPQNGIPFDNRISERIKRRSLLNKGEDYCDFAEKHTAPIVIEPQYGCKCCQCPTNRTDDNNIEVKPKEIPFKPKITLISCKDGPDQDPKKVQYYDHPNRFEGQYIPKTSLVERVDDDNLLISTNVADVTDPKDKMKQRDLEAQKRGLAAMEKSKMQREYQDLLKKLPVLQKQERIGEIGLDKEKYHMSNDRLVDLEKKRQNRLDNMYEDLFLRPEPAIVTIKPKKTSKDSLEGANRTEQLSSLLQNLKSQKATLLRELKETMSTDKSHRKRTMTESLPSLSSSAEEESGRIFSKSAGSTFPSTQPSPRKKPKLKSRRKVLVLQNMSTQTTPKPQALSAATSPFKDEPEKPCLTGDQKCDCPGLEDFCEIVIKIKDDDKPEIEINPPGFAKANAIIPEYKPKDAQTEDKAQKRFKPREDPKKIKSWQHEFTNGSISTASTTYFDLPDSKREKKRPKSQRAKSFDGSVSSDGKIDPRLLTYIKKLLNMSRASIDDLTVSGVSEVSTPSQSIVEAAPNNPLAQLQNVMKYFQLDPEELQRQLAQCESSTTSSSEKSVRQYESCVDVDTEKNLTEYAVIAASCTQKISDLAARIEKVRAEKKKIMNSTSPIGSDVEYSTTSYLDLPTRKDTEDKESSSSTLEEERDLLKIDLGYADELKKMSTSELAKQTEKHNKTDEDLMKRLERLLEKPVVEPAAPIFLDIPKLPRLEMPSFPVENNKKPPPSKGSRILQNNGLKPHELSTIPEGDSQFSARLDSPIQGSSSSKSKKANSSDEKSDQEAMESMLESIGMQWAIPTLRKTRESLALSSSSDSKKDNTDASLREFLSKMSSSNSKSDASESQNISLIPMDNRRTSTPVAGGIRAHLHQDGVSDISSVRELSGQKQEDSSEKFFDLNEGSVSRT